MKQLSSEIKRLDILLAFMAIQAKDWVNIDNAWKRIREDHTNFHVEGNNSIRIQMFNKLVKDGNLEQDDYDKGMYRITFEGLIFYERGGYINKFKSDIISSNLQQIQTWSIAIGTLLAAIATTGLLYFEYQKNLDFDSLPFSEILLITLTITIIVVWVTLGLLNRYNLNRLEK